MNYRLMQRLLTSAAIRAPETDDGADYDDDDVIDEGGDEDDPDDEDDGEGLDADDQGDDPDDEGEEPPTRQSRGQNRVATLAAERKAEKERADRLEAELAEIRRTVSQGPQKSQAELDAEEARQLAGMTPEQRLQHQINKNAQATQRTLAQIQFQSADATDRMSFENLCSRNPTVAALKDEVEKALQTMRANGTNATRDTVAKYLIGEKALAKQPRAKTKGQRREADDRDRQKARPANGRGDVSRDASRRISEAAARRKRLEGVTL